MSADLTDNGLDALLASPLEESADMGFSARVMTRVADIRLKQARREAILSLAAVALFILVALLTPAGPALTRIAEVIAGTPAVWLGAFMLGASAFVYNRVRTA
jgi:hypothetical protein